MPPIAERLEYGHSSLEKTNLKEHPIDQFQAWWQDALDADIKTIDVMHLATVDAQGHADGRMVLLKYFDHQGLVFFTNYQSQKAEQLLYNNNASATFFWAPLERQVRVRGSVSKTSREQSEAYFATRPRGAKLAAWASEQSRPLPSREALIENYQAMEQRFLGQTIPCPEHWGGYLLSPHSFEFWQGRHSRLHDRFRYELIKGAWSIVRLAP